MAPQDIRLIRKEAIYDYESPDLKIASRSENYGGIDWKGVYNQPGISVDFIRSNSSNLTNDQCVDILNNEVKSEHWKFLNKYSLLGETQKRALNFTKTISNNTFLLMLEPSSTKDTKLCQVRILKR